MGPGEIEALLHGDQPQRALVEIEAALREHPREARLLGLASDAHRQLDDRPGSLARAHSLIEHHPDEWQGYGRAAEDLIALGRADEAVAILHQGLQRLPRNATLLRVGIEVEREAGDAEAVLALGRRLIALDPDDWNAIVRTAQALLSLRDHARAVALIERGVERFPAHREVLQTAVLILHRCGHRPAALAHAQRLIHHHPRHWLGYQLAAKLRLALGDLEDARLYNRMAQRLAPESSRGAESFGRRLESLRRHDHPPVRALWLRSLQASGDPDHPGSTVLEDAGSWQPFQYWSQGAPPADVEPIRRLWNSILTAAGLPEIRLFDRSSARQWLHDHAPTLLRPFDTAFHYAIEADIFRIAYACHQDCIWLDTDLYPKRMAPSLLCERLRGADTTLFFLFSAVSLCNCFFATRAGSPFFRRLAEELSERDLSDRPRDVRGVMGAAGPDLYNRLLREYLAGCGTGREAPGEPPVRTVEGWRYGFLNEEGFARNGPPFRLAYKGTDDAWQTFVRGQQGLPGTERNAVGSP